MEQRLIGKTALVTGGSRGIGAAIVERLAAEGASVLFTFAGNHSAASRVEAKMRAEGAKVSAVKADVTDPSSIDAIRSGLEDGLDILVHNAGVADYAALTEHGDEDYLAIQRRQFAVNVDAVATLTKRLLDKLREGGRVIIVGSVNAHQMPFPGVGPYGASKAAVAAMARGWARDLGPKSILVNVIQPGPIDTEMNPDDARDVAKHMKGMTALKRYGHPPEIAGVAAFLASDDATYLTGSVIDVDGGFTI